MAISTSSMMAPIIGILGVVGIGVAIWQFWPTIGTVSDTSDDGDESEEPGSECHLAGGKPIGCGSGEFCLNGNCVSGIGPLDLPEAKSLKDMNNKTYKVQHPLASTNPIFKPYYLESKVYADSTGTSATEELAKQQLIEVVFEVQARGSLNPTGGTNSDDWTTSFNDVDIRHIVSPTTTFDSIAPTWDEMLAALGGVKQGSTIQISGKPYYPTTVSDSPIGHAFWALEKPGDVAKIATNSDAYVNIIDGTPTTSRIEYLWVQCGYGTSGYIPSGGLHKTSNSRAFTPIVTTLGAVIGTNSNVEVITGAPDNTNYNQLVQNTCGCVTKTVSCPSQIYTDEYVSGTSGKHARPHDLTPASPSSSFPIQLCTHEDYFIWREFYNSSRPEVWLVGSQYMLKDKDGNYFPIPSTCNYIAKYWTCNCPSDSVNAGQTYQSNTPCSSGVVNLPATAPSYTNCGGKVTGGGGPPLQGGGSGSWSNAEEYRNSHHSYQTSFF